LPRSNNRDLDIIYFSSSWDVVFGKNDQPADSRDRLAVYCFDLCLVLPVLVAEYSRYICVFVLLLVGGEWWLVGKNNG
jgi:hypothetical protein